MFNNITKTISQVYNTLNNKMKIALLGLIVLIFITMAWFLIRSRAPVTEGGTKGTITNPTIINEVRDQIQQLGNPFQIDNTKYVGKYPFIIGDRVDGDTYILNVNTSMLSDPYYADLFAADSNIKDSLESKPQYYTDSYQIFYSASDNKSINANNRMLNFNEVEINGAKRWFFEEGDEYWISDRDSNLSGVQKVVRNTSLLPAFRKLTRIGPAKFLSTNTDPTYTDMIYTIFDINSTPEANVKNGKINFTFLENVNTPVDPLFVGAITYETVLPDVYGLSSNLVLNKSLSNEKAIFTIGDLTNLETASIIESKTFDIKEYNSIYVVCAPVTKEKCWIYNPGLKNITQVNGDGSRTELKSQLDVDLIKLKDSLSQTFDKDKLLRFNAESNELLFFYNGKWQSTYRF